MDLRGIELDGSGGGLYIPEALGPRRLALAKKISCLFHSLNPIIRCMAIAALWLTLIVAFSEAPSLTMRQFKQLRSEAKTASEFRQVAAFADEQAIDNWRKAAECQEELDGYRSGKVPYPVIPKHPDRVQTLQSLILTYNRAAERWAHIRRHFVAKAGAADSPARHRRN